MIAAGVAHRRRCRRTGSGRPRGDVHQAGGASSEAPRPMPMRPLASASSGDAAAGRRGRAARSGTTRPTRPKVPATTACSTSADRAAQPPPLDGGHHDGQAEQASPMPSRRCAGSRSRALVPIRRADAADQVGERRARGPRNGPRPRADAAPALARGPARGRPLAGAAARRAARAARLRLRAVPPRRGVGRVGVRVAMVVQAYPSVTRPSQRVRTHAHGASRRGSRAGRRQTSTTTGMIIGRRR